MSKLPNTSKSKDYRVHRLAYMLKMKALELPRVNDSGQQLGVSHLCGNKICVNPDHLILETQSINKERQHCHGQNLCSGHDPFVPCIIEVFIYNVKTSTCDSIQYMQIIHLLFMYEWSTFGASIPFR